MIAAISRVIVSTNYSQCPCHENIYCISLGQLTSWFMCGPDTWQGKLRHWKSALCRKRESGWGENGSNRCILRGIIYWSSPLSLSLSLSLCFAHTCIYTCVCVCVCACPPVSLCYVILTLSTWWYICFIFIIITFSFN